MFFVFFITTGTNKGISAKDYGKKHEGVAGTMGKCRGMACSMSRNDNSTS